jgi:hypothetical protein
VTQFVAECRREWKRLNVPDEVANEMAAELESDLRDAEADGLTPEEVLGNGVFDPRSFAAAWASERGVVPAPAAPPRRSRRTLVAAVIGVLAIIALFAGVAVLTGRHTTQVSITSRSALPRLFVPLHGKRLFPVRPVLPAGVVRSGLDLQPAGWILLALGLGGIATSVVVWQRLPHRR